MVIVIEFDRLGCLFSQQYTSLSIAPLRQKEAYYGTSEWYWYLRQGHCFNFKVICSHCILIPHVSTRSSTVLVSNESPHVSHYNPKISASISLYFGNCSRKCTYFRYTNNIFLFIFKQPHLQCHTLIFEPGEKIKCNRVVKLCKMFLRGKGQSV